MGTHPIFESDFDCLTDIRGNKVGAMGYNDPSKPSEGSMAYPSAPPPAYQPYEDTPDPSGGLINSAGFEDSNVRRFFVRKVYSVLTLQLAFTTLIIALFNGSDTVKEALGADGTNNGRAMAVLYSSYGLFVFFYFCLVCPCCNFQRKYPLNLIFLVKLYRLGKANFMGEQKEPFQSTSRIRPSKGTH